VSFELQHEPTASRAQHPPVQETPRCYRGRTLRQALAEDRRLRIARAEEVEWRWLWATVASAAILSLSAGALLFDLADRLGFLAVLWITAAMAVTIMLADGHGRAYARTRQVIHEVEAAESQDELDRSLRPLQPE